MPGPPTALFRCDAGPAIGAGHVYRCLALASAFAWLGWRCRFLVAPGTVATVPALAAGCDDLVEAGTEQAELSAVEAIGPDLLVIDHYGRGLPFEAACRPFAGRILALDDAPARAHDCDLLLDPAIGRNPADYARLAPGAARLLLGPHWAPLRPEFARWRPAALQRRRSGGGAQRILVNFGGADRLALTAPAAEAALRTADAARVDAVVGSRSGGLDALEALAGASGGRCSVHRNASDMAALVSAADIAIGTPGNASWERCALGLPAILITVAANQMDNARSLAAAGAAVDLGTPEAGALGRVAGALRAIAADPGRWRTMSEAAARLTDGRGARRVPLALLPERRARDGLAVRLRLAAEADEEVMLHWQQAPQTRRFARNPAVPSASEHHAWMTAKLADPDCLLTIIEHGGEAAGVLRLDRRAGVAPDALEVSILIAPERPGRGIGGAALALARGLAHRDLVAHVLPGNAASLALFRAGGYRPIGGDLYTSPRGEA